MITIDKELFQWETGRYVTIEDNFSFITSVQFYNSKSKYSFDVKVEKGQALIPNDLLKEDLPIIALGCVKKDENEQVVCRKSFQVIPRPSPVTYSAEDGPEIPGIDVVYSGGVVL